MNINKVLIVLVGLLVVSLQQTQCPMNCLTCANPTSCSECALGFFLVDNAFCPPCPPGCRNCTRTLGGSMPICHDCAPPAILSPAGICFLCDPSCGTCQGFPNNCTTCRDGYVLIQVDLSNLTNFTNISINITLGNVSLCVPNSDCAIKNCLECVAPGDMSYNRCIRCAPGYFPSFEGCYPCRYSCDLCNFNFDANWPDMQAFWDREIRAAFNITPQTDPIPNGILPQFLMNLDWTALQAVGGPIIGFSAFLVFKVLQPITTTLNLTTSQVVLQMINFIPTLGNLTTEQEISNAIVRKINVFTRKNFTLADLTERRNKIVASMTACTQCSRGFQADPTQVTSTCQPCSPNCLQCSSGLCQFCQVGFFADAAGVCVPCTPPCFACTGTATFCQACMPPLSLQASSNTCILCLQPCATCLPSNLAACTTCKRPYSLTPTAAGACYRCAQDLCVECTEADPTVCTQCQRGSTLNAQGKCQLCPPNCQNCSPKVILANTTVIPSVCFECKLGFMLSTTGCSQCGPGCVSCSPTNSSICLICMQGTFLDELTLTCRRCRQGCLVCTGPQACTVFDQGIVIFGDQVISCRPGCKVCDAANPQTCLTCQNRFFLQSGNCRMCEPGCQTCTDATTCQSCFPGLQLSNADCLKCQGNCKTCDPTDLAVCLTCVRGSILVNTDCVFQCEFGCLECDSTDSTLCMKCRQGHALTPTGKCVKCLGSCSGSCDPRNITICLGCANGFQLKDNKCVRCSPGCVSCLNGQCSMCAEEFTLYETSTGSLACKQRCRKPCLTCSGTICSQCQLGFTLSNGVCRPDLSCNPNCDFCPLGTQKDADGTCIPCPTNCAACGSGACFQCNEGMYLSSTTTCTACPVQCRTCFNSQSCDMCAPGYVKQIIAMDTGVSDATFSDQCIACDPNCKTCIVQPVRCTSCFQGFRLFSSRCAGMFTVVYVYELDIDYLNFLAGSLSQEFITALSTVAQVNSTQNYIEFVRQGSTQVGGTISANSQQAAAGIQGSLGSSVPGYNVLSSSSTVYYGDSAYQKPKQLGVAQANIGLIVGCAVGGVVLIGAIIFIVYKVKSRSLIKINHNDQTTQNYMGAPGSSIQETNQVVPTYEKSMQY